MWMGGRPPLGYDIRDRKLVVNATEVARVRLIYERYLSLGSVAALAKDLRRRCIHSKRWRAQSGRYTGGRDFSRGALYALLQNRVYLGEAVHKGRAYAGEHEAIVPRKLWNEVQARLARNRRQRGAASATAITYPLGGLLFDDRGNRMSAPLMLRSPAEGVIAITKRR